MWHPTFFLRVFTHDVSRVKSGIHTSWRPTLHRLTQAQRCDYFFIYFFSTLRELEPFILFNPSVSTNILLLHKPTSTSTPSLCTTHTLYSQPPYPPQEPSSPLPHTTRSFSLISSIPSSLALGPLPFDIHTMTSSVSRRPPTQFQFRIIQQEFDRHHKRRLPGPPSGGTKPTS